jgi:hypothetical protein
LAVREQFATTHVCETNVSQYVASMSAQSASEEQVLPMPLNVRQYGEASHVAHVYEELQSASLAHALVHVDAVLPAVTGAHTEYVSVVHDDESVHSSPSPATCSHTSSPFFVEPGGHAHVPATTTSSAAHGVQPSPDGIALSSQTQALLALWNRIAGPQRSLES